MGEQLALSEELKPVTKPIKVWWVSDYELWAGTDVDQMRKAYLNTTGAVDGEDVFYDDYPYEADLDRGTIELDDGREVTFREYLNELVADGAKFPCFFAVTADAA